jgi:predicted amidohydrolase
MKAVALQFSPTYRDPAENRRRIARSLQDVEADLVVLPELFTTGYFFRDAEELRALAEPLDGGPSIVELQTFADQKQSTIVAGFAEAAGDKLFNSAAVVRPDQPPAAYRKSHLFYYEKRVFSPGDTGFVVFDALTREGLPYRLGVMICFDWYFPEAARALALGGADVIAHPSNLVRKDCPRSMPIRALENHVYTITANRTGSERNGDEELTFIGQSLICDPAGDVLAAAGREEEAAIEATFDPRTSAQRSINSENDLFLDRRPSLYGNLTAE